MAKGECPLGYQLPSGIICLSVTGRFGLGTHSFFPAYHRVQVLEPFVSFFLVSLFYLYLCIYPLPQKLVGKLILSISFSFLLYLIDQHAIHLNILVYSLGRCLDSILFSSNIL